jgi:uncharacterized glyoxalase superfamily protein PhnB
VLSELGASQLYFTDRMAAWGTSKNEPVLMVTRPYDENSATAGNGVMVALAAKNREVVDAVYRKAVELGATDEGPPGPRGRGRRARVARAASMLGTFEIWMATK